MIELRMCYVNSNFYEYDVYSSLLTKNSIFHFTLSEMLLDANEITNYKERLQSTDADAYILFHGTN